MCVVLYYWVKFELNILFVFKKNVKVFKGVFKLILVVYYV